MQTNDGFRLSPPDVAWPRAVLFETPEQFYQRVYRVLRPRSRPPKVELRFERFANPDSYIRQGASSLVVRISDLLANAPAPVMESLAYILLCKLFRRPVPALYSHRYRLYLNRREMRRLADLTRRQRGRKLHGGPKGDFYNLEDVFEQLNVRHFQGMMARPDLGWSLRPSRTRLGHFDPSMHTIIISRVFDNATVPRLALEYVMFHEMLHLRFPVEHRKTRRCVHTPAFKEAEREFPELAEAKKLLR